MPGGLLLLEEGTQLTLTATPAAGSTFASWSGGGCSGADICRVTVGGDTTVTASFALVVRCVVPNVKGKSLAAAKHAIARAHCAVGTITKATAKKVAKGHVIAESPAPSSQQRRASKVNLVVSKGKRR